MKERRFIVTAPGLAEPPSPISQAVVVGHQCWVSGQLSVSEEGAFVVAFIDLADVSIINALMGNLFPAGRRPARTIYQAAALPYGGRVKVQAVAVRDSELVALATD